MRTMITRHGGGAGPVLLLATTLAWGCIGDEIVQPPTEHPVPGFLTVQLAAPPLNQDIGAMLVVEGPSIGSVRAVGLELLEAEASSTTRRQVVVSGELPAGPILQFQVPDRDRRVEYQVRLVEVAGEGYVLRDPAGYRATISR